MDYRESILGLWIRIPKLLPLGYAASFYKPIITVPHAVVSTELIDFHKGF